MTVSLYCPWSVEARERGERMSRKVLIAESKKCVGCRICEQWCSLTHFGTINPGKSRIKITRLENKGINIPTICTQCSKAACIEACPTEALSKDPKTGAIKLEKEKCTLCRKCIHACPQGAVSIHPTDEYVLICDLCHGRPKCVENCPEGALQYVPVEISDRLYRSLVVDEAAKGENSRG